MSDLFQSAAVKADDDYSAAQIEVLEGLEPVRHRPGMYIGGTDERALHHLVAEILDNSMDEAVAGHASRIEVELAADNLVTIRDNGRGIPVDPHPKYKPKSALEVILTTLHSGGKFSGKVYETSGGLHGVGISVVNALSEHLRVEVARDRTLYAQEYSRGLPTGPLQNLGAISNRRGTSVSFRPDPQIFGANLQFKPSILFRMVRSKAYLFKGVEIRWRCAADLLEQGEDTPTSVDLHFPGGLRDYLTEALGKSRMVTPRPFAGEIKDPSGVGSAEWAVAWPIDIDGFSQSYCNTVPTPQGGTHEGALRAAIAKSLRAYGELVGNKKTAQITADDVMGEAASLLSIFIADPQFQGQTKDKLASPSAARLIEGPLKDRFDHWLAEDPQTANELLDWVLEKVEERNRRKAQKEMARKSPTRKIRLPGKLADCSESSADGTEIFLVEGDSAGGSAKQARNRKTQAILPLRGKILNVASASLDKLNANQELKDLTQALGCGTRQDFKLDKLRYERVIIMTDADVDGAHIATLLMTFFYREMPGMIEAGRLFLAMPPLYRLTQGGKSIYARDDADKDRLMKSHFKSNAKVDVSRFKGLGEMPPAQLKDTTMDPGKRSLIRVLLPDRSSEENLSSLRETAKMVDTLMGKKPELRFAFIQENADRVQDIDI